MSFKTKIGKLGFTVSIKKSLLSATVDRISSLKSTLGSYKAAKLTFLKKSGGGILTKQKFVDTISDRFNPKHLAESTMNEDFMKGANATLDFNLNRLGGIKKLKKLRKQQALGLIKAESELKRIKFIRIHGRIIPIRIKK